jgi:hypothetical protein
MVEAVLAARKTPIIPTISCANEQCSGEHHQPQ